MSELAPAINPSLAALSSFDLVERSAKATELLWHLENLSVVMPFTHSAESRELKSILQSMGLTVLNGLDLTASEDCNNSNTGQSMLIILHVSEWNNRFNPQLIAEAASVNTILCVVTGLVSLPDSLVLPQSLNQSEVDARLLLSAAGIGFFSTERISNGCAA